MCGRYTITATPEAIRALFDYPEQPNFPPRYNVAPTQPIPIVRWAQGRRQYVLVRWGLIPPWTKDPRAMAPLFNARGETVTEKPAFRNAMRRRRCLIPADGFYEWKSMGSRKQPYYMQAQDGMPFAFAGLWDVWTGPNGEEMETAAIITTTANATLTALHARMPVVIPPEGYAAWLDCMNVDEKAAQTWIRPAAEDFFSIRPVSMAVNRVANDEAALIVPVTQTDIAAEDTAARKVPPKTPRASRTKKVKSPPGEDDGQASLF